MIRYWFPDNTVLCNFASVRELGFLKQFLDGRGRWVEAVCAEAAQSAGVYPDLAQIEFLGEPIEFDDPIAIRTIDGIRRAAFGGTKESPLRHLGEAQTCWLLQHDSALAESVWVTDDREAFRFGKRQGIQTLDTADLVAAAVARTDITAGSGWDLLSRMVDAGRHNVHLPASPSELS